MPWCIGKGFVWAAKVKDDDNPLYMADTLICIMLIDTAHRFCTHILQYILHRYCTQILDIYHLLTQAGRIKEQRYLQRRLREQDAVICNDSDLHAIESCEARHDGGSVQRLKLVESTSIGDTSDHLDNE